MHKSFLKRVITHLKNGTLLKRIKEKWQEHLRNNKKEWWESQIDKRKELVMKIHPNIKMRLYFDSKLSQQIYCEDFEWQERQFINTFLRPGDVFVDVGANIGLFTLIAANIVGNIGHVYAFEPCFKTFQRLLSNVQLNRLNNVSCYQLALSDEEAEKEMTIPLDGFDAWSSLAKPFAGTSFAIEKVGCTTWDKFAQEHDIVARVTMMKIDVEGWESHVLLGGKNVLSREDAPILQVEFTEQASKSAGSSCAELYHMLEELKYQMFIYDAKSKRLVPDPLRENYPYINLIATKRLEENSIRMKQKKLS